MHRDLVAGLGAYSRTGGRDEPSHFCTGRVEDCDRQSMGVLRRRCLRQRSPQPKANLAVPRQSRGSDHAVRVPVSSVVLNLMDSPRHPHPDSRVCL
jgi:hypothetical protein